MDATTYHDLEVERDQLAMERDELEAERDALAMGRDELEAERDALAAHVERINAEYEVGAPLGRLERIGAALNESPTTSLARLKADILMGWSEKLKDGTPMEDTVDAMADAAKQLRCQAKGGDP